MTDYYMALYATLGLQGLWEGYFSKGARGLPSVLKAERTSWWSFGLELAAFPLALAGMFLYAVEIYSSSVAHLWRGVVLLLFAVFVLEWKQHHRQFVREPDARLTGEEMAQAGSLYAAVVGIFELPCLWMNFRVAFPS